MYARLSRSVLLPRPMVAFAVALMTLAGTINVQAAKEVFERTKPHVNVGTIGDVNLGDPPLAFRFESDIQTGIDGTASGFLQFVFPDGSIMQYQAVFATITGDTGPNSTFFSFLILPFDSGRIDPERPAIAVARQNPEVDDCIIWDVIGSQIFPESLQFEVPGKIQRIPASGVQPGSPPWFSLSYPQQQVMILETDLVADFWASATTLGDYRVKGWVELGLPDGQAPIRFEPLFGAAVADTNTGVAYIVILMVPEGAPLALENLVVATVRPDSDVVGCDIWDLTGGEVADRDSDGFRIQFEAAGRFRIHRSLAIDPIPR